MKHTAACLTKHADALARRDAWLAQWPNYCRKCDGAGGTYHAGYFDYRAGVGEPPSFDECEGCLCHGLCPRCGEVAWSDESDEGHPCRFCGWNYDDSAPEVWDCDGDCDPTNYQEVD